MNKYLIQYSYTINKIAVSDWHEHEKIIQADNIKEACAKFNKWAQRLGTWLVLDCIPIEQNNKF